MTRTLLVTNDFPPKIGGIQSYLDELWGRLDPTRTSVLTASSHPEARDFDAGAAARGLVVERVRGRTLWAPTRGAGRALDAAIDARRPDLVLYDPFVPLGLLGDRRGVPYGVVLHGAEVAIPSRLPGTRAMSRRVLAGSVVAVSAGSYPEAEARRAAGASMPPVIQVPPGVDTDRFVPLDPSRAAGVRARLSLPASGPLVTSVGRLVPRKGIDVLLAAAAICAREVPELTVVVAGDGRDRGRLLRVARRTGVRAHFVGRVSESDKIDLLGASDVFCQPCRSRWGGLEQEGFGIVFLEAAACGVPQVAGRSGGSYEAVVDAQTGVVVDTPSDPAAVAAAIARLLADPALRAAMGGAARRRAEGEFGYDRLARRLQEGLDDAMGERRRARS